MSFIKHKIFDDFDFLYFVINKSVGSYIIKLINVFYFYYAFKSQ
ncbi:hypothetical protein CYD57_0606 [Chlamydia psittaci]|nr:putative membrane protein [Chlamydia psittaci 84-8471/1]UMB83304.1 hypothetical protein CYD54_0603 [Chlamydia psittaci]UMB84299.1 hypothetical protein CYD57_0606 [Chlamydia psittaci]UZN73466.1 hypothetical protein BFAmazona13_0601 [Chlamydia psittaci]